MSRRSRSSAKRAARFSSPSGWCPRSAAPSATSRIARAKRHRPATITALDRTRCADSRQYAPRGAFLPLSMDRDKLRRERPRLLGSGTNDDRRNEENRRDSSMAARYGATGKAQADFLEQAGFGQFALPLKWF